MATTTENLGMTLPGTTDPVDVTVLNGNFSALDAFAGQQTAKDTEQDGRMTAIENEVTDQDSRLTALETSVAALVDVGPKNKLDHTAYTRTVNGVTYTVNADRSVTITSDGTNTLSQLYLVYNDTSIPAGSYVLSGCTGGSSTTFDLRVKVGDTISTNYDGGTPFQTDGSALTVSIIVRASQTLNVTIRPMICTADDYAASPAYAPYTPTLRELYEMVLALQAGGGTT